jgi:hypothetical protein
MLGFAFQTPLNWSTWQVRAKGFSPLHLWQEIELGMFSCFDLEGFDATLEAGLEVSVVSKDRS